MAKWKRAALSRLVLRYPSLLCFLPRSRPLVIRRHPYPVAESRRDLLVFLPGIGDSAADFEDQGFVELVRKHQWAVDVALVDAHYGYYADRTILEQLHQDVFLPAREMGYRHTWLAGISLGGFGALLYASRYGKDLAGVVALAPFLGAETIIQEISTAGGLARWTATVDTSDEVRVLWNWLKAREWQTATCPRVFLGFGEDDVFAEAHRMLARNLPDRSVVIAPGGHRWSVWYELWDEFLRRLVEGMKKE